MEVCPSCGYRDPVLLGKRFTHEMNRYQNVDTKEVCIFNETDYTLKFTDKVTEKTSTWVRIEVSGTGEIVVMKAPVAPKAAAPVAPVAEELPKVPIKPATLQGPAGSQQT